MRVGEVLFGFKRLEIVILKARLFYLGLSARWIHEVLTGHLDGLFGSGELRRVHKTLLPSVTVRVRNSHQIRPL